MQDNILVPKYRKNKKPVKIRKPSKPIDGINHRLLAEQAAAAEAQAQAQEVLDIEPVDDSAPTRIELVAKATELGLKFTKRTSDEKLLALIEAALKQPEEV
jgi:hypothetical protein